MAVSPGRFTGYGWPVLTSTTGGPLPRLRKWWIPGTDRHIYLRDGSVGFVLVHMILWWHERLEDIDDGIWDEWGWADRDVRGSTVTSEHAGGVAADVNATKHPMGVAIDRTFTKLQILRMRTRLRLTYKNKIQWGGDFRSRPDGMHINPAPGVTLEEMERLARRLMNTPRGRRILAGNPGAKEVILS